MNTDAIRVFVRVRPPLGAEREQEPAVKLVDARTLTVARGRSSFSARFDGVLGGESTQADVFACVRETATAVLDGYNATILAYGQTGSGKSFTMQGVGRAPSGAHMLLPTANGDDQHGELGVLPRMVSEIFALVAQRSDTARFAVAVSFIEIYNDQLSDLLWQPLHAQGGAPSGASPPQLALHADASTGEIVVANLLEVPCSSAAELLELVGKAASARATRATRFNEHSSRSHAIVQLLVEQRPLPPAEPSAARPAAAADRAAAGRVGAGEQRAKRAKLNLVDLAGSERPHKRAPEQPAQRTGSSAAAAWHRAAAALPAAKQGHEGPGCASAAEARLGSDAFKEATSINGSLLCLANCIAALTERGRAHVPFRDSALTRLLQDALGGNSLTTLIAAVSPAAASADETVATLRFADRARRVLQHAVSNELVVADSLASQRLRFQQHIARLVAQIDALKHAAASSAAAARLGESAAEAEADAALRARLGSLLGENGELKAKAASLSAELASAQQALQAEREGHAARHAQLQALARRALEGSAEGRTPDERATLSMHLLLRQLTAPPGSAEADAGAGGDAGAGDERAAAPKPASAAVGALAPLPRAAWQGAGGSSGARHEREAHGGSAETGHGGNAEEASISRAQTRRGSRSGYLEHALSAAERPETVGPLKAGRVSLGAAVDFGGALLPSSLAGARRGIAGSQGAAAAARLPVAPSSSAAAASGALDGGLARAASAEAVADILPVRHSRPVSRQAPRELRAPSAAAIGSGAEGSGAEGSSADGAAQAKAQAASGRTALVQQLDELAAYQAQLRRLRKEGHEVDALLHSLRARGLPARASAPPSGSSGGSSAAAAATAVVATAAAAAPRVQQPTIRVRPFDAAAACDPPPTPPARAAAPPPAPSAPQPAICVRPFEAAAPSAPPATIPAARAEAEGAAAQSEFAARARARTAAPHASRAQHERAAREALARREAGWVGTGGDSQRALTARAPLLSASHDLLRLAGAYAYSRALTPPGARLRPPAQHGNGARGRPASAGRRPPAPLAARSTAAWQQGGSAWPARQEARQEYRFEDCARAGRKPELIDARIEAMLLAGRPKSGGWGAHGRARPSPTHPQGRVAYFF